MYNVDNLEELRSEIEQQAALILSRINEYHATTEEQDPIAKLTAVMITELSLLTVLVRHSTDRLEDISKYVNTLEDRVNDL